MLAAGASLDALGRLGGRMHPIVVHFPIAMLIVGAGLEMIRAARRDAVPSPAGSVCAVVGAVGAVAGAGLGWLNAAYEQGAGSALLEGHRWLGLGTAAIACLACVLMIPAKGRGAERSLGAYRAALLLAALTVGVTGHLGGSLVYGEDYLWSAARAVGGGKDRTPEPANDAPVPMATGAPVSFARDVLPILDDQCVSCHGSVKRKGGLRLDSRRAALQGGKGGPAIVVGDPTASPLIRRVLGLDHQQRMPVDADPLSEEEIGVLARWIRDGAEWPEEHSSRDEGPEPTHWAYTAPAAGAPADPRDPIDAIVRARLEREGLTPAPEAGPGVLLRRVSLDLTGLPPTVAEMDAFAADREPGAYERAVERLLASPAYGERWAKWWLDLARYADSRGYEKDQAWSMWAYRDWVIGALNADMPFDRFTVEQLAGDLIPGATASQVIATGFSRCSMINEEGGVDPEEFRVNTVVDRTSTVATVWLGTTLACAQCHDHKFDPFTQRDFYRFYAFFNNTPIETQDLGSGETKVESPEVRVEHPMTERWIEETGALRETMQGEGRPDAPRAVAAAQRLAELEAKIRMGATTQVMRELEQRRATHVLLRGSFLTPGEEVTPGTPDALPPMSPGARADRLGLAEWLVSKDNPLTARVTVNRVWAQYFGHGLVETDEDFGTRGTPPTHPELLDHLAREFVAGGWSLKSLHRKIVLSATYRRASEVSPAALEKDPRNLLYARGPRFRLDAETIRDQALSLAGLLSHRVGGPSVFPAQPPGVWGHAYSGETWTDSTGEDRHRRGLYTFWKRATPYPSFVAFDAPTRQVTCTRRPRTNTALQALTTLNDPVYVEAAGALAGRVMREGGGDTPSRAAWAVRVCTGRAARPEEIARIVALYEDQAAHFRGAPAEAHELLSGATDGLAPGGEQEAALAAWTVVANVILNLDEVLTKG